MVHSQKALCFSEELYVFCGELVCRNLYELKGDALALWADVPSCRCVFILYKEMERSHFITL